MNNNKKQEKKDLIKIIVSILVILSVMTVNYIILAATNGYNDFALALGSGTDEKRIQDIPEDEPEHETFITDGYKHITDDGSEDEDDDTYKDTDKASDYWKDTDEASKVDKSNEIINPIHQKDDQVKLNTGDPIFNYNHSGELDTGDYNKSKEATANFCMNSSRLSSIKFNGVEDNKTKIVEKVSAAKAINAKRKWGEDYEVEKEKDMDEAEVDGFIGYAVWQWKKGQISTMELQEMIWQSGIIGEYDEEKSKDEAHYVFDRDDDGNIGFVTEEGNKGISKDIIDKLLNGGWSLEGEDRSSLKRPVQYDEVYDKIFNNLKEFFKGDLTYFDGTFEPTEDDLKRLEDLVTKYGVKCEEAVSAMDFNNNGEIDKDDIQKLREYIADKVLFNREKTANDDAYKYAIVKANVDSSVAQPLVDQRNNFYVLGPYSVDVDFNRQALEDPNVNVDEVHDMVFRSADNLYQRTVVSDSALDIFIKELKGTNEGEKAKVAIDPSVKTVSKEESNQFAWLDDKGISMTIASSTGAILNDQNSSIRFIICDENGNEVTNEQAKLLFLEGKNFFIKIQLKDYQMINDIDEYEIDFEKLSQSFQITMDLQLNYIDQFYVSREIYHYVHNPDGDYVQRWIPPIDGTHNYEYLSRLDGEFKKELNKNYKNNIEEHKAEFPKEFPGLDDDTTTYKMEYEWDTSEEPVMARAEDGVDKATWYAMKDYIGYYLKVVEQKCFYPRVKYTYYDSNGALKEGVLEPFEKDETHHTIEITPIVDYQSDYKYKNSEEVSENQNNGTIGEPERIAILQHYNIPTEWSYDYTSGGTHTGDARDKATERRHKDSGQTKVEIDYTYTYNGVPITGYFHVKKTTYNWIEDPKVVTTKYNKYIYTPENFLNYIRYRIGSNALVNTNGVDSSRITFKDAEYRKGYTVDDTYSGDFIWYKEKYLELHTSKIYPGAHVDDPTVLFVKNWKLKKTIIEEKTGVTAGYTTWEESGSDKSLEYTSTYHPGGQSYSVDNILATFDEWTLQIFSHKDEDYHFDGYYVMEKIRQYEWQDFEHILDVAYTVQEVRFRIEIDISFEREIKIEGIPSKGLAMDIGGKVWIDTSDQNKTNYGEMTKVNGRYDDGEKLYEGILVCLGEYYYEYNNKGYYRIKEYYTVTGSDGSYQFLGLNPMSKYCVEFYYNGQLYQPTYYKNTNLYGGGYSNAYERELHDNTEADFREMYNTSYETVNGELTKAEADTNYYMSNNLSSGKAYGLNHKIMNGEGEYVVINNQDVNGDKEGTQIKLTYEKDGKTDEYEITIDQSDYYTYGLASIDDNATPTNGKDGILTYGDAVEIHRQLLSAVSSGVVYRDANYILHGDYAVGKAIDANDNINLISSKQARLKALFKQALIAIDSKFDSENGNKEIDNIYNSITESYILAFTDQERNVNSALGEATRSVKYPTKDYFILEDVKESKLGHDKAYQKTYTKNNSTLDTKETPTTLFGTFDNQNKYGQSYRYSALDYLYTEGHEYNDVRAGYTNVLRTVENSIKYYVPEGKNVGGGVDFGLTYRARNDIEIDKDVAKVTLTVNGQKLEYDYGEKDFINNISKFDVTKDKEGLYNGTVVYNREIRTADYLYNSKNDNNLKEDVEDNLKVYVTYAIMVKNNNSLVTTKINELVDYYDNDGFEFSAFESKNSSEIGPNIVDNTYIEKYDFNNNIIGERVSVKTKDNNGKYIVSNETGKYSIDNETRYYGNHNGILKDSKGAYNYSQCSYIRTEDESLTLKPGEYALCYVTYKVAEDENGKPKMDQLISDTNQYKTGKRNIVEINSYSTYYAEGVVVPGRLKTVSKETYDKFDQNYRNNNAYNDERTGEYLEEVNINVSNKVAGIIDIDSNPGSVRNKDLYQKDDKNDESNKDEGRVITDYTNHQRNRKEDDTAEAPNVRLIFNNKESDIRSISGMVFEDMRTQNVANTQAQIGDGMYTASDKRINGVTIQLIELETEVDDKGVASKIIGEKVVACKKYNADTSTNKSEDDVDRYASGDDYEKVVKTFKTDGVSDDLVIEPVKIDDSKDYNYSFTNVPAGYYFVRFIYGDTQETVLTNKTASTEEEKKNQDYSGDINDLIGIKGRNETSYNGQDYKSTVYNPGSYKLEKNGIVITAFDSNNANKKNLSNTDEVTLNEAKALQVYGNNTTGEVGTIAQDSNYGIVYEKNYNVNKEDLYTFDIFTNDKDNKEETPKRYSDAKDVYAYRQRGNDWANGKDATEDLRNYRAEVLASPTRKLTYDNDETNATLQKDAIEELEYNTQMVAQTGIIDLKFEIEEDSNTSTAIAEGALGSHTIMDYSLSNVDFGLTERPRAQLKLTKQVANFKFVLQNGSTLVDSGTAQNDLLQFEKHNEHEPVYNKDEYKLDYTNANTVLSGYRIKANEPTALETVAMALDDELMAGSSIEVTYNIKVTNVGDVDYTTKNFYYSGIPSDENNISKTKAVTVIDYPSNYLQFSETDQTQEESKSIWRIVKGIETTKVDATQAGNGQATDTDDADDNERLVTIDISKIANNDLYNEAENIVKTNTEDEKDKVGKTHDDPSWAEDYTNRQYTSELKTYKNVLATNSLNKELLPILQTENKEDEKSSINRNLIMKTTVDVSGDNADNTYNNLAEIVATYNDQGRRMQFSIVGNEKLAIQNAGEDAASTVITSIDRINVDEIDADSAQKIQLRAPTGEDKSYVLLAATIMAAIALIAGAVVVLRKVIK